RALTWTSSLRGLHHAPGSLGIQTEQGCRVVAGETEAVNDVGDYVFLLHLLLQKPSEKLQGRVILFGQRQFIEMIDLPRDPLLLGEGNLKDLQRMRAILGLGCINGT